MGAWRGLQGRPESPLGSPNQTGNTVAQARRGGGCCWRAGLRELLVEGKVAAFPPSLENLSGWSLPTPECLVAPLHPHLPQWKNDRVSPFLSRGSRRLTRVKHATPLKGCNSGKRGTRVQAECQGWGADNTPVSPSTGCLTVTARPLSPVPG